MTEQFGTAIKDENGTLWGPELVESYDVAKALAEVTNSYFPEGHPESLVIIRVQEVGPNGQRKIEERARRQEAWEQAHLPGTTVQGERCVCSCHEFPGALHFAPCCHPPYFDKTEPRE